MNHFFLKFKMFRNMDPLAGGLCAGGAFLIWGLSPLYWRLLAEVPPFEIILHRIVWSLALLLPLILISGQARDLARVFRRPRMLLLLCLTAVLVAANWLIYIWAVNNGFVLQASLGYYINPLVNVILGMAFLGERLTRRQGWAVGLAALGVAIQTVDLGAIPWISLALAFSFGIYGLIRKMAAVEALVGLTVETLILSIPAVGLLVHLDLAGQGAFGSRGPAMDLILVGAALVTAVPLLLFNIGARRIHLATVGLLQYIAPSGMFLLAVLRFHEPVAPLRWVTFGLIWTALGLYSAELAALANRNPRPNASEKSI
jgi:chloramphenicol-sensitive protein RarD